jgi:hypothetical protein
MSQNDQDARECVERLIEAMAKLRIILEQREQSLRQAIDIPTGSDFDTSLRESRVTENREDLNEALFLLEKRRRESRVASFRSALDHGVSINELSRIWGFSRQMASRYAKEAREGIPTRDVDPDGDVTANGKGKRQL